MNSDEYHSAKSITDKLVDNLKWHFLKEKYVATCKFECLLCFGRLVDQPIAFRGTLIGCHMIGLMNYNFYVNLVSILWF